jgi:CDP-paratose 2-epimerase
MGRLDRAPVLITGGAGFIGTNLAHRLASSGRTVTIYDNLARLGVDQNLRWLQNTHGSRIKVEIADIRDRNRLREAIHPVQQIFHLAAQVAVTTSLAAPMDDFEINTEGTLNLLDAVRDAGTGAGVVFTSTNKVYGAVGDLTPVEEATRYVVSGPASRGIGERQPLDFHSPYGCSKGAADQYVLDYARSFGLFATVFRMSCIYGPHQHGTEDQGWIAHFLFRALQDQPITLYGTGKQVRDVLFVDDLVNAMLLGEQHLPSLAGKAFNIGGGPENTTSLTELLTLIRRVIGKTPAVRFAPWRPSDQRWYVTDHSRFSAATGWMPQVRLEDGLRRLRAWALSAADHVSEHPAIEEIAL